MLKQPSPKEKKTRISRKLELFEVCCQKLDYVLPPQINVTVTSRFIKGWS